jgi:hypothetical protein
MASSGSLTTRGAAPDQRAGRRTGREIITRIIEALHYSRRLEAARVLRRYHHLIAEESLGQPKKRPPGAGKEAMERKCQPR